MDEELTADELPLAAPLPERGGVVTDWLRRAPAWQFAAYAVIASFSAYFCMYAFRKAFLVTEFRDIKFLGVIDLKTAIVISQIIGYTLSKYLGIKICSEVTAANRHYWLVGLVLWALGALFLFAVLPYQLMFIAMFLNGLSLGMVMGMVLGYLEGRRTSDVLLAGMSCSYIVSSATVKDCGVLLMKNFGVSESWMPAAVGVLFLPIFLFFVWMLHQIPPPTRQDEAERVKRQPMGAAERNAFLGKFLLGLSMLLVAYLFLTGLRDFRDSYGKEILRQMGYAEMPGVFLRTEVPAFIVLALLSSIVVIRDNRLGVAVAFGVMILGIVLVGAATWLHDAKFISGLSWLTLIGVGTYMAYVPYTSILFDRLIAAVGVAGTAVFAVYLADAIGYSGSTALQIYKDVFHPDTTRDTFFHWYCYVASTIGTILLVGSAWYFLTGGRMHSNRETAQGDLS